MKILLSEWPTTFLTPSKPESRHEVVSLKKLNRHVIHETKGASKKQFGSWGTGYIEIR